MANIIITEEQLKQLMDEASIGDDIANLRFGNVAKGLKARVALVQGEWATAATYAAEARSGYTLMDETTYAQGFQVGSEANSEFMWV